mgnify:CR=1 FL=1
MYFMGIDLGTTNVKIALYDGRGNRVAGSRFHTPHHSPLRGWVEYDPAELWDRLSDEISSLMSESGLGKDVAALAVSSQAETGLFVGKRNEPLSNMIVWHDRRTEPLLARWEERMPGGEVFRITGLTPHYIYSLLKMEWMRDHWAETYRQAARWHCMSDYFTWKICGVAAMDYSIASRTMALDIEAGTWSERMFSLAGIRPDLMPPLKEAGTLLGEVLPEVVERWKINPGAKVAVGGHDHPCGCFGLQADREEVVVASIGTTESVCLYRDRAALDQAPAGYTVGRHVFPGAYYWIGGIPSGGETIDWAIRVLMHREPGPESYAEFAELASKSPPGSNGVLFLPHLKGCVTPVVDPHSRGGFWGLGIHHRREDLCRAVLEGLGYEFRYVLELAGADPDAIIAIGGGTRNDLWMRCKADILNLPIQIMEVEDAVTLGAAKLAAKAAGMLDLNKFSIKVRHTVKPDPEAHLLYDSIYRNLYKRLYSLQKSALMPQHSGGGHCEEL